MNGDVLNISGGDGSAEIVVSVILPNTFVTDTTNWASNSITVNQAQNVPSGMVLTFVHPESTMQNASEEYLPTKASSTIIAVNSDNIILAKVFSLFLFLFILKLMQMDREWEI